MRPNNFVVSLRKIYDVRHKMKLGREKKAGARTHATHETEHVSNDRNVEQEHTHQRANADKGWPDL